MQLLNSELLALLDTAGAQFVCVDDQDRHVYHSSLFNGMTGGQTIYAGPAARGYHHTVTVAVGHHGKAPNAIPVNHGHKGQ